MSQKHQNWQEGCPWHRWHQFQGQEIKGQSHRTDERSRLALRLSSHHLLGMGHIVVACCTACFKGSN